MSLIDILVILLGAGLGYFVVSHLLATGQAF